MRFASFIRRAMLAGGLAGASLALAQPAGNDSLTKNPNCTVPFPAEAMKKAPAGFQGKTYALLSFNVKGEFRSARLLRSSGNRDLDSAALRAAASARCEPLGDTTDPSLQGALIGIPYEFSFDNSRAPTPAQTRPVR